jgi:hypothetical protein
MKNRTIPGKEQEQILDEYWVMLSECKQRAIQNNDRVLKHWVEEWYKSWNRVTLEHQLPNWGSAFDVSSF